MINKHICNFLIFTFALGFALAMAGCGGAAGSANLNASSSVVIIPSVTSATEGQQVNLTASISPSLATGTVSFYNGSNLIGTATVSNVATSAIAELSTTFSSPGTQTITAKYSGNQFFASSTSSPATIGVYSNQLAATTTILQTSNAAPAFDTNVTLTAMVSPSSATGSVTFYNGAVSIGTGAVSSGAATLVTQFAAGGTIALKAIYSGDYFNATSTSSAVTETVSGPLVTSTSLEASTPAIAAGGSATLTATVSPSTATGSVTFYNGSTAIGTGNISSGVATLTAAFSTAGQQLLTASFNANSAWETSKSNIVSLFVTGVTPSTVTLQSSPSNPVIGDAVAFTATVTPTAATGTMNLYNGNTFIGTASLSAGVANFTESVMASGPESFTAVYSGDTTYLSSSGNTTITVGNPGPNPTVTALTLGNTNVDTGDYVTMTANVAPAAATGQVTFMDGDSPLGTASVSSGTAVYSAPFLYAGTFNITAVYNGDPNYAVSTSNAVALNVIDDSDDSEAKQR